MPTTVRSYRFKRLISKLAKPLKHKNPEKSFDKASLSDDDIPKLTLILTQYKRKNIENQLKCIQKQTLKPDLIVVFQNGDHAEIDHLSEKYQFLLVKSQFNTKYFGRFSYCLSLNSKFFIIMDDDILPAKKCFETYLSECERLNAIIGANGRIAKTNPALSELKEPCDIGIREDSTLVDFVGHMWVIKSEWLHDMFAVPPKTKETGEDMHLCFAAKLRSGVPSYVCRQRDADELSDVSMNDLAVDGVSSFQHVTEEKRKTVEEYFRSLGLEFISKN